MSNTGDNFHKGGGVSPLETRKNTLVDMSQMDDDQFSRNDGDGSPQYIPPTSLPPIIQHREVHPESQINEVNEYEYDEEYVDEVDIVED